MNYKSIVFSGLPGAGKSTLVEKLSDVYGWPVCSVGNQWRARWKQKYPSNKVPFEEYWRTTSTKDLEQINMDFAEAIIKGNMIGDSRYAIYLRNLPVLLVFLSADLETRASRAFGLEKYKDKPIEEIKQILQQREVDEIAAGRRLYSYDYRDSCYYHVSINTGMLSQEEEIAIIRGLVPPPK
jgi:cytidylate kinase